MIHKFNNIVGKDGRLFFTSDNHFGHENIIKYCNRPFENAEQMDNAMINNWNAVVTSKDTVIHVGDFTFYKDQEQIRNLIRSLNGRIIFVRGNHDEYLRPETLRRFDSVHNYYELAISPSDLYPRGNLIVLFHFPIREWNRRYHGSWHLHGHSHGTIPDDINNLSIDVGVDCHNFTPISYEQIELLMSKKNLIKDRR